MQIKKYRWAPSGAMWTHSFGERKWLWVFFLSLFLPNWERRRWNHPAHIFVGRRFERCSSGRRVCKHPLSESTVRVRLQAPLSKHICWVQKLKKNKKNAASSSFWFMFRISRIVYFLSLTTDKLNLKSAVCQCLQTSLLFVLSGPSLSRFPDRNGRIVLLEDARVNPINCTSPACR